jgi:hypothetical protein
MRAASFLAILAISCAWVPWALAGKARKWDSLPEAVRAAIVANGGVAGQSVDLEPGKKNGQAVYEASIKDKDGKVVDLVVLADGKLYETKTAAAADRASEILAGVKFSHPRNVTNPYFPLATLKQDILEGTEAGKKTRVERTLMPDKHKTFRIGDQTVESLVMEDRIFEDGKLAEVALDYFAQDDGGTVYYIGEDVDEYTDGKVASHEGAWLLGKDTPIPGVILPAHPKIGDKFKSEDVSKEISESDEVVSVSETVTVPAGTYQNCVKVKESLGDGATEYKYYAKGVGAVREVPSDGDELLISHNRASVRADSAKLAATSEPDAREALKKVGVDSQAEAVWVRAINDPTLAAGTRAGLIEDLNEVGFANPAKPTKAELPMIKNRLELIKRLRPKATDDTTAAAFDEARKDLEAMAAGLANP